MLVACKLLSSHVSFFEYEVFTKKMWPSRRTDTETVPPPSSNAVTSSFRFNKTVGVDSKKKRSEAIVHGIGSFPSIAVTGSTIPEQTADKTEAAVGAHVLDASTYSDILNGTLNIDGKNSVTPKAQKVKLK